MDPYQVLGIMRGATSDQIKAAYRRLALMWHPDRNKAPNASAKFIEITEAYDRLTKPGYSYTPPPYQSRYYRSPYTGYASRGRRIPKNNPTNQPCSQCDATTTARRMNGMPRWHKLRNGAILCHKCWMARPTPRAG